MKDGEKNKKVKMKINITKNNKIKEHYKKTQQSINIKSKQNMRNNTNEKEIKQ